MLATLLEIYFDRVGVDSLGGDGVCPTGYRPCCGVILAVCFDGVSVRHGLSGCVDALDADIPRGIPRSRLTLRCWTRIILRFRKVDLPGTRKWIALGQQQPPGSQCEQHNRKNCKQSFHVLPSFLGCIPGWFRAARNGTREVTPGRQGRQVIPINPNQPQFISSCAKYGRTVAAAQWDSITIAMPQARTTSS